MSFRGISSITGGGGFSNYTSTARPTQGASITGDNGPFTLPRKGGYGQQQRGVAKPQESTPSNPMNANNMASGSFGAMMFTPRPPNTTQPTTVAPTLTSGRIMSASASRPQIPVNTSAGPTRPNTFGLDLAALLANLDGSSQRLGPNTQQQSAPAQIPSQDDDTKKTPKKPLAATVPQVLPVSSRVASAGRFGPAPQPPAPKPVIEEPVDEPKAHSPAEKMQVPVAFAPKDEPALPADGSKGKMSPAEALAIYDKLLSRYERREILEYDEVYFLGVAAQKIDAPVADGQNFGYDDERGDYVVVKGDHIAFRYEVISELGKGSFGQVLKVHDYKKNSQCALKIIRNKKRFHQQATVEIRILDHLRSRDPEDRSCTVRMLNYFKFRSHTIVTFEMHSMNLYELAKLNKYQPFAPALIKRFTAQILVAMSFMWREQIVHCDLKPENILLRYENKTSIKIIDFGSSCFESERIYTYIQSRFYRAPEIILGLPYGRPIDLWSLGCIICEMQMGYPIFPGESEKEQLLCVMEVLGVPPPRMVERSPRKKDFFDTNGAPKLFPNSRNKVRKPATKDIMKTLRTEDASFVDFILCFLQWEPAERMTPNEAMRHPWIAECFQQDTVEKQPPGSASQRPRLNSARPTPPQPPSGAGGLPSIDASGAPLGGAKGVNAWRLTNRKIGSAQARVPTTN